ncbi:hypothetical protein A3SI_16435 [Nitritalea halalkaliphila LW7]|uniref:Uncharacterized protein n=1 Tax=Nitritalea halalkaliphila LW7 TaxID=1189621 RepID=I5BX00_9BACT|nr:hypothetical protein A3SI_16435 [Nitritalea halalkaliphila LW7]
MTEAGKDMPEAEAFFRFVQRTETKAIFAHFGFQSPTP